MRNSEIIELISATLILKNQKQQKCLKSFNNNLLQFLEINSNMNQRTNHKIYILQFLPHSSIRLFYFPNFNIQVIVILLSYFSFYIVNPYYLNRLESFFDMIYQTPEKPSQNFLSNVMQYPKHTLQLRKQFLVEKSAQQIKNTPMNVIEKQFKLLCHAEIDEGLFHLSDLKANRYCDICAYQHSRVNIPQINQFYINANQVKSMVDNKTFAIFSQAPYKIYDSFWEAVYYKNIETVIMLCKFYDPNRGQQSEQYWPDPEKSIPFSNGTLKVTNQNSKMIDEEFVESVFLIEGSEGTKILKHYHWTGWSDLKKPIEQTLHNFQFLIKLCNSQIEKNKIIWIHCSAGIGRTGTLAAIVDGLRYFQKNKKISIFGLVENLRKFRYHAVQSLDQYRFLYSYFAQKL